MGSNDALARGPVIKILILQPDKGSIGHPLGHPVGHHQGWPLSPWILYLSIVGLNPMCDTEYLKN